MRLRRIALSIACLGLTSTPLGAQALDQGAFRIYLGGHAVGTESFLYELKGDSLVISSHLRRLVSTPSGDDTLDKVAILAVDSLDYDLRSYQSTQKFQGKVIRRGVFPRDTTFAVFREIGDKGSGDQLARPPGHLYIVDPQVFVLFDVMCRTLQHRVLGTRPIWVLTLGVKDSVISASATDLGTEEIRWGSRQVQARKLRLADPSTQFIAWVSPAGRMLRLSQPEAGVTVERQPPPARRVSRAPRPGG
jgi:hypothetical protein